MTPVTLLVGFCATMAAIAVGRLAVDECRDRVDAGTALVVIGITLVSASWVFLEESVLTIIGGTLLAIVGFGVGAAGIFVMVSHWIGSPEPVASED